MKQKNLFKKTIYFISFISTFIYILYRILFTLPINMNFFSLFLGIIVLFTELWESFNFFIYYFNILKNTKKNSPLPPLNTSPEYPDIDIFIATLNEHDSLLKNTINCCKNINYPDKNKLHIYVCDDGNRNNVKELCKNFNVNYITRLTNKDAKAGNYNNALKQTHSPYIAFFDADMCPTNDFLELALPYFLSNSNKKIGFVQFPQSFKNPDIFQYRFNLENKIPFEQEYFYNTLQIEKNQTNSVVFCGTNALVSRSALNEINGFATGTISEDIATGMLIENAGYTGIALNNITAYGNSVTDFTGFAKQRSRWARGCVQMSKKYKIFTCKGLSLKQKLEYFSCVSYWYFGIRRLVYLIAPLLFSLCGITVINCNIKTFICLWLPCYLLKRFAIDILEQNQRSSTWNTIYETILTPILAPAVTQEFLGFHNTKFDVTPKGTTANRMSKLNFKVLVFHLIFFILNFVGFIISALKIFNNGMSLYILPLIWTLSNAFYLLIAIIFDLRFKKHDYKNFVPNKTKKYPKFSAFHIFFDFLTHPNNKF